MKIGYSAMSEVINKRCDVQPPWSGMGMHDYSTLRYHVPTKLPSMVCLVTRLMLTVHQCYYNLEVDNFK